MQKNSLWSRRRFLAGTGSVVAGSALAPVGMAAKETGAAAWPIGCFNRPWGPFSYDQALDGLKAAGFELTGLVGHHRAHPEPLLTADAEADYLKKLRERIEARGLDAIIAWISGPKAREHAAAVDELKRLVDNAGLLGLEWLLSGGPRRNETIEYYSGVMAEVTAYAADHGIKMAMKPHGGNGAEVLRCLELVNHANFSIWYDAGNIIYYTGEDPVKELKPLAKHVTGFCAKDCAAKGTPVMLQFGTGGVNFRRVFQVLKDAGFCGPVMIECTADPDSPEDAVKKAKANRDYLKKVFAWLK